MRKLLLGAATLVTSLGLTTGVAAAQSGGIIRDTGPYSSAKIITKVKTKTNVENKNTFKIKNQNTQHAWTGDAKVHGNTHGRGATSGNASNKNSFRLSASVNNSADTVKAAQESAPYVGGGRIVDTGPDSEAKIVTKVKTTTTVNNENNFYISNTNNQSAFSGDAKVSHNTHGGDATSGDAHNSNSTSITLSVTN